MSFTPEQNIQITQWATEFKIGELNLRLRALNKKRNLSGNPTAGPAYLEWQMVKEAINRKRNKPKDKVTVIELYNVFDKINQDILDGQFSIEEYRPLSDWEYYADQIDNLYGDDEDLSKEECEELAKQLAELYVRIQAMDISDIFDEFYGSEDPIMRDLLLKQLQKRGHDVIKDWWHNHP